MKNLGNIESSKYFDFGDSRLNKRLDLINTQLSQSVGTSTPFAVQDKGQIKGYYRFINNEKVVTSTLIEGYGLRSNAAISGQEIILAVQDTTSLHYSTKRSAPNLDCIEGTKQKGFMLHNHLLMSADGCPFGLFSQTFFARKAEDLGKGKKNTRKSLPISAKESYRWLQEFEALQEFYKDEASKTVIEICDREADIHELLAARKYDHVHYIIRSSYERNSLEEESIWEQVANMPFSYQYDLKVPESNDRSARVARMEVRYKNVTIKPSYRKLTNLKEQELWIVETREVSNIPQGEQAIHWRLLTSIPVLDADTAAKIIGYYVLRWIIERFHYVLKQGTKVQELQIKTKNALQNAIILKSWQAVDVMLLQYLPQTAPHLTLQEAGFTMSDYEIAYQYAKSCCNSKEEKQDKPLVGHFTRIIAQIGGHSLQKSKTIGIVSIWRGWNSFCIIKKTIYAIKLE